MSRMKLPAGSSALLALPLTLGLTACPFTPDPTPPSPVTTCTLTATDWARIESPGHSAARQWNELALHGIRSVLPSPTAHARTLYHLSAATFDTWAASQPGATGVFSHEKLNLTPQQTEVALNHAAFRVLTARFGRVVPGLARCFEQHMTHLRLNPADTATSGAAPAAFGNRVAQTVLDAARTDGANETGAYADTSAYAYLNDPLRPELRGVTVRDPDHWQRLLLAQPFTQNGIPQDGPQVFMGAHWGAVTPFATAPAQAPDPGAAPSVRDPRLRGWIVDVLRRQSELDPQDPATVDLSPGATGNNTLGRNDGRGYTLNPATGQPYAPNVTRRADYGRVIAEYWADGPRAETPPGHWNVIANSVADDPRFQRRLGGSGPELSRLEWDVKTYLALNGALHDAAIAAWSIKRRTDGPRPITLVRYLAQTGTLTPEPDLIREDGDLTLVRGWQPGRGVTWEDARTWVPFQLSTFVTPAFPGFISGHSTFSRAAAEVLTDLTGSAYFPGGLREERIPAGHIGLDRTPTTGDVRLQWATYRDAADQAGQSRIWGGIHLEPDDLAGRVVGERVGLNAVALARTHFGP